MYSRFNLNPPLRSRQPRVTTAFPPSLALVEQLGDENCFARGGSHRVVSGTGGHTGCVNTLDWDDEGRHLASAGDDTKICLWRAGVAVEPLVGDGESSAFRSKVSTRDHPTLRYGLTDSIATGHTANIFDVKFAPYSASKRLFSVAGDSQVRVFDLEGSTPSTITGAYSWNHHGPDSSACVKVFKCHQDRVKKIATEQSSDVFMTCGEDGTVRQFDLRSPHTCSPTSACPDPLLHYPGLALYALSISKMRPHIFLVAGRSPFAFLHDRRMIREAVLQDWDVDLEDATTTEATHCVRRLSVLENTADGDRSYIKNHIVSAVLSQSNPHEALLSYSGDKVYLFNTESPAAAPLPILPTPASTTEGDYPRRRRGFPPRPEYSLHAPIVPPLHSYAGHRNNETVKDVAFVFGDSCVASGSDDGNLFIWDKTSEKIKGIFHADESVVNVIQSHPTLPIIAVSGIDPVIKVFAPTTSASLVEDSAAESESPRAGENLVSRQDLIVQANIEHADTSDFSQLPLNSQAMLQMLAGRLAANGDTNATPDNVEIISGPDGIQLLVDGEPVSDCSIM